MPKKVVTGIVTGDKNDKTRRVEVARTVRHSKFGKLMHRRTICYAHDEKNESKAGDKVEIVESRPLSRLKRWELVRIVSRGPAVGAGEGLEQELQGVTEKA